MTPAIAQFTIINPNAIPALIDSNDSQPVELGVKFKADSNGYITGLRYYKASSNTGTHVGHIWSKTGVMLGSVTFTNETGSGWQQANFSSPIAVSANTTYIASYFAPTGHYSANDNFFAKTGIDSPPLHALANGADGPNGVYRYSSRSGFPTSSYLSSNYWVDVVYTTGTTTTPNSPKLTLSATSLSFGSVAVNSASTQTVTLTSSGTSALTVNSASITGTGFTIVAGTFPATLNPNQSLTLQVQYKPAVSGSATGQLAINSNSTAGSTAVVSLNGTGAAASPQLSVGATSLSFGSVAVDSVATKTVTLTSSGTSAVTVNAVSVVGAGFATIGGSFPVTLNPGQSTTLQVQFKPVASGSATGQLTISSNSANGSTAGVALSGTGTSSTTHQVSLSWNAPSNSPSSVVGYNIYRSVGGGSQQLVNPTVNSQTVYVDSSVVSQSTYSYTVNSVASDGAESTPSNQFTVTIP